MGKLFILPLAAVFIIYRGMSQEIDFQLEVITHLNTASKIIFNDNMLYAATTGGLLTYNLDTDVFDSYTTADGFFNHQFTAMSLSEKGLLVLGSLNGNLAFWDLESKQINNDRNLVGNQIVDILAIEDTLWVLAKNFVSVYLFSQDKQRFQFRESYHEFGINVENFHALEVANNRVWLGSNVGLLSAPSNFLRYNLYTAANWRLQSAADGLPGNEVNDVLRGSADLPLLYLATNGGLAIYDFAEFRTVTAGLVSTALQHLYFRDELYAVDSRRAYRLSGEQFIPLNEAADTDITDLAVDNANNVWIANVTRGLHNLADNRLIFMDGPLDNYIGEMLIDSNGNLWCTSGLPKDERKTGLFVRTAEGWVNYLFSGGNNNRYINLNSSLALYEDSGQNIWIGSWGGGLIVFDSQMNFEVMNTMSESGRVRISSVNRDEVVEFQTDPGLLNVLSPVVTDPYYVVVTDIIFDFQTESIWILNSAASSNRALIKYNAPAFNKADFTPENLQYFENPFSSREWFEMTQDVFGDLWLVSDAQGIAVVQARLSNGSLNSAFYNENDNMKTNATLSINADDDGYVWVGSNAGLNAILNGLVFNFLETYQPIGLRINDIYVDSRNNKWFATNRGLSILKAAGSPFEPSSWIDIVPRNSSISPEQLAVRANLFVADLSSENIHSVFLKEETGDIYLGTDAGITVIRNNPFVSTFPDFEQLKVGPNPFVIESDKTNLLNFYNLLSSSEVKILTTNGQLIRTLSPENFQEVKGSLAQWDGRSEEGRLVASGVYVYLITNEEGQQKAGKVLVIQK